MRPPQVAPTTESAAAVRIEPLRRGEPGAEAAIVGMEIDGEPLNIFATLARHPELMRRVNALGGRLLGASAIPDRDRELVILRTCRRSGARYEFAHHRAAAQGAGLTAPEIDDLAGDALRLEWAPSDLARIGLVDEMCSTGTISDETWAAAMDGSDDRQRIELLFLIGFYRMMAGFVTAVGVELEPGLDEGASTW